MKEILKARGTEGGEGRREGGRGVEERREERREG